MIDINQWMNVLTKPVETFKKYKGADMGKAFWTVVISSLIAGFIAAISNYLAWVSVASLFGSYAGAFLGLGAFTAFTPIITIPVSAVVGWLIFAWLVNWFATSSKLKSKFEEVASLISIILAPILVLTSIAVLIPFVGFMLRWLVVLYSLYLVALALNEYYKLGYNLGFGTGKKK